MNVVFTVIVLLSFVFAGVTGSPAHSGQVSGHEAVVTIDAKTGPASAAVTVGGGATVEVGGVTFPGKVVKVDKGSVTVESLAPEGPAEVRFDEQYAMKLVSGQALEAAKKSKDLVLDLVGAMVLFLGLMKVVEAGGGLDLVAKAIRPALGLLFPDVPANHPAMGAIVMNIAANVLGLGNAATPFGIRAMEELDKLNKEKGTATNAMVLFLAINTSGVAVLPTGVMAIRAAAGGRDPAAIFPTTLAASLVNTVIAVIAAKAFSRLVSPNPTDPVEREPVRLGELGPLVLAVGAMVALMVGVKVAPATGDWIVPGLIAGMVGFGAARGVKVYEVFIEGARDGFMSAIRILPYVVAILVAVAMFRWSGGLELFVTGLAPVAELVGMPPEVLPLALLRPLSGSGAFAMTAELTKTYGPDSFIANVAGTLQGTTETTFYVLAVYFGAVGVKRYRHAVATGMMSDLSGMLASVFFVRWLIGTG